MKVRSFEGGFDEFEEGGFDREIGGVGTEGDAVQGCAQGWQAVGDAEEPAEGAVAFESGNFQEGVGFGDELGEVSHIGGRKSGSREMEELNFCFGRGGVISNMESIHEKRSEIFKLARGFNNGDLGGPKSNFGVDGTKGD